MANQSSSGQAPNQSGVGGSGSFASPSQIFAEQWVQRQAEDGPWHGVKEVLEWPVASANDPSPNETSTVATQGSSKPKTPKSAQKNDSKKSDSKKSTPKSGSKKRTQKSSGKK